MNSSLPEEVVKATTKCRRSFSCLAKGAGESACRCEADLVLGKNLISIRPLDSAVGLCPYLMHFGNGHICQCPTHFHLLGGGKRVCSP